jgi:hypothetical protein
VGEEVLAVLVGVAHDEGDVAAGPEHAAHPDEGLLHGGEVAVVRAEVGEVPRVVAPHVVVGAAVGVGRVVPPVAHGALEVDVVGRVRGDEVEGGVGEPRRVAQQLQGVAGDHLLGAEGRVPGGDLRVDLDPAGVDLDPDGRPRRVREGGAEEGPPHAGEGVEDAATGPGEELDQGLHEPRGLVGPVAPADLVAQLPGIGGPEDGAREEEPVLPVQLVEGVPRVFAPRARRGGMLFVLRGLRRERLLRRPGAARRGRGALLPARAHFFSHFRQAAASVLRSA